VVAIVCLGFVYQLYVLVMKCYFESKSVGCGEAGAGAVLNASALHALNQLFASLLDRVHTPATNALQAHSN
jgi:hypothetical protein